MAYLGTSSRDLTIMLAFVTLTLASAAVAQDRTLRPRPAEGASGIKPYPLRPVRIVVPVSAGGGVDSLARLVGQHFNAVWGQPFIVDNRAGAGGTIGVDIAVRAAADGYTLLVSSSSLVTNAAIRGSQEGIRQMARTGEKRGTSDVREQFLAQGADPIGNSPPELRKFLVAEIERWTRLIQKAKIRAE